MVTQLRRINLRNIRREKALEYAKDWGVDERDRALMAEDFESGYEAGLAYQADLVLELKEALFRIKDIADQYYESASLSTVSEAIKRLGLKP